MFAVFDILGNFGCYLDQKSLSFPFEANPYDTEQGRKSDHLVDVCLFCYKFRYDRSFGGSLDAKA